MRWPTLDYRTRDHGGREVMLRGVCPSVVEGARDQKADQELSKLRRRVLPLVRRRPSLRTIVIVMCVIGPLLGGLLVFGGRGAPVMWALATVAGLMFMAGWLHRDERRGIGSRISTVITAFLADGRCPGCGYSLVGTPTGDGGRVRCPECAAEWRGGCVRAPIRPVPPLRPPGTWLGRAMAEEDRESGRQQGRAVADADGRALLVRDPGLRRVRAEHVEALGAARVRAIRSEIRRAAGVAIWPRIVMIVMLAGAPIVLAGMGFTSPRPGALISQSAGQVFAGVMLAGILAWMLYDMLANGSSVRTDKLTEILVSHRVCPACLGAMDQAVHAKGRVECPGCEAVWVGGADLEPRRGAIGECVRSVETGAASR
jgi:hypothetical protein